MPDRAVKQAYAAYDSDPRVSGPDDRDAFVDAIRAMPGRAVVDDDKRDALLAEYEAWAVGELSEISDEAMEAGRANLFNLPPIQRETVVLTDLIDWKEKPRAVVAISEDRQWLVTPDPAGHSLWFVFRWEETARDVGWMVQDKMIEDTGQSADEVLAEFLREREK